MQIGLDTIDELRKEEKKPLIRKTVIMILISAAIFLFFLNLWPNSHHFMSPLQTAKNIGLWFWLRFAELTHHPTAGIYDRFPEDPAYYSLTFVQVKRQAMTYACGMLLTLSGMIFQSVFRNPMAAPTILGVSNGINAAMLYLVITYGGAIVNMPMTKYKYCYIGAAAMLTAVMILGKISSGRGRFSVNDLLLVGVASSAVVGAILTAIMNGLDEGVLLIYQQISAGGMLMYDKISLICLGLAFAVSIIPMFMMRFAFNAVTYSPDEMQGLGMHPQRLRFVTLILGTLMITAAMIHCGAVGMMSLAVPHISRYLFGSEFRKMFWGNMFLGGLLLILCRGIADMIPFGFEEFPMGVIVNLLVTPIFAWFMASSKRGWD